MVTICTRPETATELQQEVEEVMTRGWGFDEIGAFDEATLALLRDSDAVVVGPGLGRDEDAKRGLSQALSAGRPLVVHADALRILAELPLDERTLAAAGDPRLVVLTPHPGEAGALLGLSIAEIESNRFLAARNLAERSGAIVILKGSRTIIAAPGRAPVVSAFGSPAMATAGSGDVLSGLCGALLAGAVSPDEVFERAQTAVALHALAGERWEQTHGDRGLLASEIADLVPEILSGLHSTP
jgi:NAD(P)H-hydrate epimerase